MLRSIQSTSKKGLVGVALILLTIMVATGTGFCKTKKPKTVAVFPFAMNSSQDLGFLQNGLFSMLSSRLSDAGKVDVLDRETVDKALEQAQASDQTKGALNESKARLIGASLGVDYVLFGSLTSFGESVSLDASMVDVTGKKETLAFFEQSNSMGDVIPLVNSFAGDINMKMFNRNIDNKLYVQQQQEPQAPGGLQFAGGAGMYGGGMMAMQGSQGFTTHLQVKDIVRGMVTGDLNKDGKMQVVAAADNKLMFYRVEGTMLVLEETLEYESHIRILALDIADINGNGYPELYVSALTVHLDTLASFIVEYDGNSYATLVEDEALYYRVVTSKDGQPILLAQDKGEDPFDGRIHIMTARGGDVYTEEKRIRMPRGTSVLSMAKGPVRGADSEEYLTINRHYRLVATNDAGGMEWESTHKYGKTNNIWLMPKSGGGDADRDRVYLNPRIKFYTLGEDETAKAIVIKNT
ncbi:MAG: hypothetical protein MI892_03900, partial [Desulfobacterales bacterium]|nr:hypothetical protein [Desulfobacterales bacterium]